MDDLLKDAIADAKAVRETALANAKIALEEAFTPRLKSMLSRKIESEMDAEEQEDAEEMEDEDEMREEEDAEERMDADEMEMDADEMKMDADEMEMDAEEMMDKDEMEDAEEEEEMDESEDKEETEDEMSEVEDKEEEEKMEEAEDAEEEDELDLESVLAELEADLNKDEEDELDESEDKEEEEKVEENDVSSDIGKADNKVADAANDSSKVGQGPESEGSDKAAGAELGDHTVVKEVEDKDEEDLDLDEVLKALTEEEDAEEEAEKVDELKKEIKETRSVVKFMRAKLNEVNLLNAKLLFSNKLFRAFGLNNNQKLKVVETFDRTKNLREVKLVYATLAESFKKPSKTLSESVVKGSSSKPVASTKPAKQEVLSEGQELKARFKKLANIL